MVWLNDAQHYMDNPRTSEKVAAQLRALLTSPERRPVLVLGTLWPEFVDRYTALPMTAFGDDDPYNGTRDLLAGCMLSVPDAFREEELNQAAVLAQADPLLADSLTRTAITGQVTQDLAGAPELLRRYTSAAPPSRALLEAAMDARRLGVGLHLSRDFLSNAAVGYLKDQEFNQLSENWVDEAYADLARPVHGKQAPLTRARLRPSFLPSGDVAAPPCPPQAAVVFRLADYLEQYGRDTRRGYCPPDSFWHAAGAHTTASAELSDLARAAQRLGQHAWAHHLRYRAFEAGDPIALYALALIRLRAGDETQSRKLLRQAADAGCVEALYDLALLLEQNGDSAGAEVTALEAAQSGGIETLYDLAVLRERTGDVNGAQRSYQQAAEAGDLHALIELARLREEYGARNVAHTLYQRAAEAGDLYALVSLTRMREEDGDKDGAEALALDAAASGYTNALYELAQLRERAGDPAGAAALYQRAAETGDITAATLIEQRRRGRHQDGQCSER
ncbi:tetratricopeptide repeat protein [Streptomyces sp. NPDC014995]|uniref:tetratricopeptide repeat protein n=1 Tax=Streptomyces sp. NPDC014995 TaxID=3364936 RepID=UPI0036F74459